jgi:hypothetical protein
MRRNARFLAAFLLAASLSITAVKGAEKQKTFVGSISDSMCGLKHMMPGGDKECTLKCVEGGSKFVLADTQHKKVYELSDQDKPREFAGQKVKVTGTLSGDTISVSSIEAAQ